MAADFQFKDKYDIGDLLQIMTILRRPEGGCPWDAAQTHKSIRRDFIEETYEVIEAINKDDKALLREELGDVLMQVVFHTELEREAGNFDFSDVADGICKKLIERHPHVFGEVHVDGTEDVLTNWDAIKRQSKKQATYTSAMKAVPRELPALMRAEKIHHKAVKSGVLIDSAEELLEKLEADVRVLGETAVVRYPDARQLVLGKFLFDAASFADLIKADPEMALTKTVDDFIDCFGQVEDGGDPEELKKDADDLWNEVLGIKDSSQHA
ncbi:MAG: nucleoside triphosphate pyrophosphohydrolase [Clostridia bacterium]|nr:nucleoside triphosphate pyrophosphohydrolase [Clostridia bacterium]